MREKKEKKEAVFHLTVKAVIVNEKNEVLILRRSENDSRSPGKMDLPGGGVEDGESLEEGLRREIKEELGIEVEIGPIVHHVDWEQEDPEGIFWKGVRFLAFYRGGEIKTSDEHENGQWLGIDEAVEKMQDHGFEKDKRDAILKAKSYMEMQRGLDGWRRCLADFENYKKRQVEARKDFRRYAMEEMVLQVLPILDNFRASTEHVPDEQKESPWVTGIMYIQKQLEDMLRENGVEEIEAREGENFNPEVHEAIQRVKSESDEGSQGKIGKVIQKGYKIDGKVIRPARVAVE